MFDEIITRRFEIWVRQRISLPGSPDFLMEQVTVTSTGNVLTDLLISGSATQDQGIYAGNLVIAPAMELLRSDPAAIPMQIYKLLDSLSLQGGVSD